MKRSLGLIILFALSGGSSVAHLINQYKQYPTLEEDVKNTLKNLYITLNDNPILEKIPENLGIAAVTCAKHYQEMGVIFFHFKTVLFLLTLLAVVLMFLRKKAGYYIYLVAQVGALVSIFIAFGINAGSLLMALISALVSLFMLWLYKKLFLITL